MDLWLALIGAIIVLLIAVSLQSAPNRSGRPGRGWDRFSPPQKLALGFLVLLVIALLIARA